VHGNLDADVIIAGAGPAGAASAIHLRKAGLRVMVADWQTFPRDKVCGDFVSAVALKELQALGVTTYRGRGRANVIRDAAVFLDGRHLLTSALPRTRALRTFGRVIPRETFDDWLVAKARADGASLAERHRVVGYRATRRHVEVDAEAGGRRRTLRARALIGADGSTSVVARLVRGERASADDRVIAVRAYFEGVRGPSDRADLYFSSAAFPGYGWLFPTGPHTANVGVGMVLRTLPPSTDHLASLLRRLVDQDPGLHDRLRDARLTHKIVGWPLTTFNPTLPVVSDRVILVGDAAGLINPLNGEGIQYALLSGRWAAETLVACASRGDFSRAALEPYAGRVDAELRSDLGLARVVVQLIRNRALNPLWLEALQVIVARAAVDAGYAEVVGGVLAGVVPVRRVLDLGIVRRTLQQAVIRSGMRTFEELSYHPTHLARLGVRLTQAALDMAKPMLTRREDTERWAVSLGKSLFDVSAGAAADAAAAIRRARPAVSRDSQTRGRRRRSHGAEGR
jgi:geranylgeranyl reductase family protein